MGSGSFSDSIGAVGAVFSVFGGSEDCGFCVLLAGFCVCTGEASGFAALSCGGMAVCGGSGISGAAGSVVSSFAVRILPVRHLCCSFLYDRSGRTAFADFAV